MGADPRLLRLGQTQQKSQGGRHATEAVVLRKHPSLVGGNGEGKANVDSIGQAEFGRAEEDNDDEIALRRMAIRARQATQSYSVHLDEELQVWGQLVIVFAACPQLYRVSCAAACPVCFHDVLHAGERRHLFLHLGCRGKH